MNGTTKQETGKTKTKSAAELLANPQYASGPPKYLSADEIIKQARKVGFCNEHGGRGRRWDNTPEAARYQRAHRLAYRREWIMREREYKKTAEKA